MISIEGLKLTRRDFIIYCAFLTASLGLSEKSREDPNNIKNLVKNMVDIRYSAYNLSVQKFKGNLSQKEIGKLEKKLKEKEKNLYKKNNIIDIKKNRKTSEIRKDFLKKDFVYFKWRHPMIGGNSPRTKILHNTINEYLGRLIKPPKKSSNFGCNSKSYDCFITSASLKDPNTIVTFDDYILAHLGLGNNLGFWNFNQKIYENRAVIEKSTRNQVAYINQITTPLKTETIEYKLLNATIQQWMDHIPEVELTEEKIIRKGIEQKEILAMCYHEPSLIEDQRKGRKGNETKAFLEETKLFKDFETPSFLTFSDIYHYLQNKKNPFHKYAIEFTKELNITDFNDVLKNPQNYVFS